MGREASRFERVFEDYSRKLGFDKYDEEIDHKAYDMSSRLKLADIVAREGKRTAGDLGSEYGGMSHALKAVGIRAVSTEYLSSNIKFLKKPEGDVVRCDSFHLPLKNVDALVSYMFLGKFVPHEIHRGRNLAEIFGELSMSADAIYSVELQAEYSHWFESDEDAVLESNEIEDRLKAALPNFEVKPIGDFGLLTECGQMLDRIGFRFTKKGEKHGKQQG